MKIKLNKIIKAVETFNDKKKQKVLFQIDNCMYCGEYSEYVFLMYWFDQYFVFTYDYGCICHNCFLQKFNSHDIAI